MKDNSEQPSPIVRRWPAPPPMQTGAPCPELYFDGRDLYCTYYVYTDTRPPFGNVAVLRFDAVLHFCIGHPNDEALQGHALYKQGLGYYGFFVVEHSPLIQEIETRNRVHRSHQPGMYSRFRHWIATFHDETLEVASLEASFLDVSDLDPLNAIRSFAEKRKQS